MKKKSMLERMREENAASLAKLRALMITPESGVDGVVTPQAEEQVQSVESQE